MSFPLRIDRPCPRARMIALQLSAPVLALTGQVQEQVTGVHAFQDIDLEAAFEAVAAYSQTVHPGSNHAQLMTGAIKTAMLEQGVGHLVFPDNTQTLPAADGLFNS